MSVPAENPDIIEMAIRTSQSDNEPVNKAAEINWRIAQGCAEISVSHGPGSFHLAARNRTIFLRAFEEHAHRTSN